MYFNENNIKNIMLGATLLASGGGGSYSDGLVLLDNFKKANPDVQIRVRMIENYETGSDDYAMVIAGIGAPTGQADQDFSPCALSCYDEMKNYICPRIDKVLSYTIPVEMGGFNTLVPMLVSMKYNIPIVNADGAGRAVPTLTTTIMAVKGIDAEPVVLTDANDNRVSLIIKKESSKDMIENISRVISEEFNANAAIGGWLMNNMPLSKIATGTILLAKSYGDIVTLIQGEYSQSDNIGELVAEEIVKAGKPLTILCSNGKVTQFSSVDSDGFDVGGYKIVNNDENACDYRILFKNENLLIYKIESDGDETIYMTAPDIITVLDRKTGMPLTNEDLEQKAQNNELGELEVVLVKIKVDDKWWDDEEATLNAWKPLLSDLGYAGKIVKY